MLFNTGQACHVRGFHDTFDSIKDVPVATVATGYRDQDGNVYILVIHEALYFGAQMDHFLYNPNQIRHFGTPVSDDPYDNTRSLGIDHSELFIPFHTEGCTIFFDFFLATDEDIDSDPHIVLTDGAT